MSTCAGEIYSLPGSPVYSFGFLQPHKDLEASLRALRCSGSWLNLGGGVWVTDHTPEAARARAPPSGLERRSGPVTLSPIRFKLSSVQTLGEFPNIE